MKFFEHFLDCIAEFFDSRNRIVDDFFFSFKVPRPFFHHSLHTRSGHVKRHYFFNLKEKQKFQKIIVIKILTFSDFHTGLLELRV